MRPTLTISLSALAANYQALREAFSGQECAGVVKANAYGLGVAEVSRALHRAGCRTFFVATLEEGAALRTHMSDIRIFVFHGPYPGEEKDYLAHRLLPVLNHPEQLARWDTAHPFALHVDTGMNRLGFTHEALSHRQPATGNCQLLLSHLACANEPEHAKNAEQLARFQAARALLPGVPASLCNSSGIFLPREFHADVARPGCSLYGIAPHAGAHPIRPVATLTAPILQIRTADRDDTVGYGATFGVKQGDRIAIVQMGYADGYARILSNKGTVFVGGHAARVAGRVSMDMIAVDVQGVPESAYAQATEVEILNAKQTVDDLARASDTIGYEVFTRLGARVKRVYVA